MADLAKRFTNNPIITPADIKPSQEGLIVECVLNPGAFKYQNKTGLLMRIAENAPSTDTTISVPLLDETAAGGMKILKIDRKDLPSRWHVEGALRTRWACSAPPAMNSCQLFWGATVLMYVLRNLSIC